MVDTLQPQKVAGYSGSLLWVNDDQNNRTALPHRKRVFGHVQQNYRKWKRGHNNEQLRASIHLPGRGGSLVQLTTANQTGSSEGGENQTHRAALTTEYHGGIIRQVGQGTGADGHHHTVNAIVPEETPSPLLLLRRGNSDPFSSFSFAITARVNEVITFIRDIQLPTLYYSPYFREATRFPSTRSDVTQSPMGWISTPAAVQSWKHPIRRRILDSRTFRFHPWT